MDKIPSFIFNFIFHPGTIKIFFYLKIFFIAVFAFFSVSIFILLLKASWLKRRILEDLVEFTTYKPFGAKKDLKKWIKVNKKIESGEESEYKLAIIEADSLLDDTLEKMGYKGGTLEEKLKKINPVILPNIKEVIRAHKIRNNIVYDPDYKLSLEETKKILRIYEKSFHDLELF